MFEKYMHIEKLGNDEVEGVLEGKVSVFPKIDGTNSSLWFEDGIIKAGSRNRELTLDNDNAGFCEFVKGDTRINAFFKENPNCRLYGEWLVPHSLKTYEDSAWRKFYIFDMKYYLHSESDGSFVPYETYKDVLDKYELDYISPIIVYENATEEKLIQLLDKNTYLIKDGEGVGEGIVIKNYDYKNKYGRTTWAKIVTNSFKDKNRKAFRTQLVTLKDTIEKNIIDECITKELIDKEYEKIKLDNGGWNGKCIARLLSTVYHCLINEELWNILKKNKNITINFKLLNSFCISKIKEVRQDIF